MDKDKKFEILLQKIAQVINLAAELGINLQWPMKVAARTALRSHHKQHLQEVKLILTPPETAAVQ